MDKNFSRDAYFAQKKYSDDATNQLMANPADEFSMNLGYLQLIWIGLHEWSTIIKYGIAGQKDNIDYYTQLQVILENLSDLLSAKDDVNDLVDKVEGFIDEIDKIFIKNSNSGEISMNREGARKLRKEMRSTLRDIISRLQQKGLLTNLHTAPGLAMSEVE